MNDVVLAPSAVVVAAARVGNGPEVYGVIAALGADRVAVLPADPQYRERLGNIVKNTATDRTAEETVLEVIREYDHLMWAAPIPPEDVGPMDPDTTLVALPLPADEGWGWGWEG